MANTVKVRALRPFFGVYGKVAAGDEVEVSEAHAKRYQQRGLAVPANYKMATNPLNKMEAAPANKSDPFDHDRNGKPGGSLPKKEAAKSAPANPSAKSPDGGSTGAAKRSLSSPAAPAPKKPASSKSKAKPA